MPEVQSIIEDLGLIAHPEGGFYKEMYRSKSMIKEVVGLREKSAYTSIYYLLAGDDFSSWHRIKSDETWFFHQGCDLLIYFFDNEKRLQSIRLGLNSKNLQATIPANTWFAAKPTDQASFSLMSCAVAPGFEFDDFELGNRQTLLSELGGSKENIEAIERLTRRQ